MVLSHWLQPGSEIVNTSNIDLEQTKAALLLE